MRDICALVVDKTEFWEFNLFCEMCFIEYANQTFHVFFLQLSSAAYRFYVDHADTTEIIAKIPQAACFTCLTFIVL